MRTTREFTVEKQTPKADTLKTTTWRHIEALAASSHENPTERAKEPETVSMIKTLLLAAVSEVAAGLALLIVPSAVGRLLLGQELAGAAIPVARVLGVALISLGIACWPGRAARFGMVTYSALATGYLAWLGICGDWVGYWLWPAVVLHLAMTVLLVRAGRDSPAGPGDDRRGT